MDRPGKARARQLVRVQALEGEAGVARHQRPGELVGVIAPLALDAGRPGGQARPHLRPSAAAAPASGDHPLAAALRLVRAPLEMRRDHSIAGDTQRRVACARTDWVV